MYTMSGTAGEAIGAVLFASEPLGADATGWLEAPEYSMLVATRDGDRVALDVRELEL